MKNEVKQFGRTACFFLLLLLVSLPALAQNGQTVRGTVVDSRGDAVIGASIRLKGNDALGTITDVDGRFTFNNVPAGSTLIISYIGMQSLEVRAAFGRDMKITLEEDAELLDEVIVVGFGQQKKESVVGAIAQTSAKVLERTGGVSSLGQALTGNLPGVVTMTTTGKPGEEDPQITIRGVSSWNGSDPLVLVDGIERPMNSVDINSVATISVLKDASATAVFGVRGANGVILITTKRGEEGKANININVSTTLKTYSKLPAILDAYDTFGLRNKVIEGELGYTPTAWGKYQPHAIMDKYRNPANTAEFERYPNVNWVDELLKDVATSYNANISVAGGTSFVKYYASMDYQHEGDIYKQVTNNRGYQAGYGYDRINVRSNLDFNLTKTTKLSVNLSGSHAVQRGTNGYGYEYTVWAAFYGVAPDAFRPKYSDGTFGYYYPNPTQASANSMEDISVNGVGYTSNDRLNTDFTLVQDLSFLLKGLSIQGRLAFDNAFQETGRGIDDINDWEDNPHKWIDPDTGIAYTDVTTESNNKFDYKNSISWMTGAGTVNNWMTYRRLNYSAQIKYGNTFGLHSVGAMGNFSREEYATGDQLPFYRENWVFRGTYDYAKRYLIEYNGAYNGSEKFASDYRFAFFQSGAVGWVVTEEPWFKKLNMKWFDYLKFRASYGEIGDDNINDRWLYADRYAANGSAFSQGLAGIGDQASSSLSPYTGYHQTTVGNPNVHWEKAKKTDIAAEFGFLGGAITGSIDFFSEKRSDILLAGGDRAVPAYFGATAPTANLGEVESKGYELEVRWSKPINDWRIWGNASYTHATNKILNADDPQLMPEYQKKANKPINQTNSYVDKGYYNNWDELYGSTSHDALDDMRMPGNYIILDYDADGIISSLDNIPYGFTGIPQNTFNAQIGVDYKGWSFFVQFYGVNNVTRYVGTQSLGGVRNIAFDEGSYWSKEDMNADVPLPRWGTQASTYTPGTRYLYDGSYLRLKYAELSYTFDNNSWIKKVGLSSLKIFGNGNNLFLWTKMPDDRESNTNASGVTNNSSYPTARRFNLGLRITL
ncbi:MAG: TonB-dependent receptor [Mediterranea sp.]|jgi:TonB-linked SusC/RagA family outer membrane protein|nr:TonB-dependent receptor [Mediterranea sp.]